MFFYNEVVKMIGKEKLANIGYNIISLGGKYMYIDGFKEIIDIAEDHISVKIKGGMIEILGERLKVRQVADNSIIIGGGIYGYKVN